MIKNNCSFEYELRGDELYLRLCGEVDHHSAATLRRDTDALICETRPRRLTLDLSEVGFMDSSGLGFIMGRYKLMKENGGVVEVINTPRGINKVLKISGLDKIITIGRCKNEDN